MLATVTKSGFDIQYKSHGLPICPLNANNEKYNHPEHDYQQNDHRTHGLPIYRPGPYDLPAMPWWTWIHRK